MSNLSNSPPVLAGIGTGLRTELLDAYNSILRNYLERRWEPSELNGGKLCEVVYTILKGHVDGSFPRRASKPGSMVDACRALEQVPGTFPRSVRIQIPRMLMALYEIRNNRGVGHVGGDVNPNLMDAAVVLQMSKWLMAELVRLFHAVTTEKATEIVDSISERIAPVVWEVNGKRRVLNTGMTMMDKMLVLLYHSSAPLSESDLVSWVEHSNASVFRRDVLRRAHKKRLIEYDEVKKIATLSPLGIQHVEENLDLDV